MDFEYDSEREKRLRHLFETLKNKKFPSIEETNKTEASFSNFAFFESYFSNYTIGIGLGLEEAIESIRSGKALPPKKGDSHDILGTYRITSDRQEMSRTPHSREELIEILQKRHSVIMADRPDCLPGEFKTRINKYKDYVYVDPTLVKGTLLKGFEYYEQLEQPFARALYMKFMIAVIHPFIDGNGRMSRIMMNAELTAAGQSKILIPTIYREVYINGMRTLCKEGNPLPFISAISRIRKFSTNITGEDFAATRDYLEKCNAFLTYNAFLINAYDELRRESPN